MQGKKMSEQVLCISEVEASNFLNCLKNFDRIGKIDFIDYNDLLYCGHSLVPREIVEDSPEFKQIIPYVVIRNGLDIFHYQRGKKGGESRLHSLYSIGVGGHISEEHMPFEDSINACIVRELQEEVGFSVSKVPPPAAVIYDPKDKVGEVHFGIVFVLDVECKDQINVTDSALIKPGWVRITDARSKLYSYENWSELCLHGGIL